MKRRVHTLSYFLSPRDNTRDVRAFQTRDEAASREILSAMIELGYAPGESYLNPPPRDDDEHVPRLHVDLGDVASDDLIVLTTRPPMHDWHQGDRKKVKRGYTDLEDLVFDVCLHCIVKSSRTHIILRKRMVQHLAPGFEGLGEMRLGEAEGAPFKALNSNDGKGLRRYRGARATATFLLRVDSLWEGGPGFLCAFGGDGTSTLAWAYWLRHGLQHLLEGNRFLVARMTPGKVPLRATNRRWARDWNVDLALDVELPAGYLGPRPRVAGEIPLV